MGECRRCGTCCRAIAFPYTKAQLRRQIASGALVGPDYRSARFVLRHWRRISRSAAAAAVPGLGTEAGSRYYACAWLQGNTCADHERRPEICRGFPYYGDPETTNVDARLPWSGCGYHSAIGD